MYDKSYNDILAVNLERPAMCEPPSFSQYFCFYFLKNAIINFRFDISLRSLCTNGEHVLVGRDDGTISVLNLLSGAPITVLRPSSPSPSSILSLFAHKDGEYVASGDAAGYVTLWSSK